MELHSKSGTPMRIQFGNKCLSVALNNALPTVAFFREKRAPQQSLLWNIKAVDIGKTNLAFSARVHISTSATKAVGYLTMNNEGNVYVAELLPLKDTSLRQEWILNPVFQGGKLQGFNIINCLLFKTLATSSAKLSLTDSRYKQTQNVSSAAGGGLHQMLNLVLPGSIPDYEYTDMLRGYVGSDYSCPDSTCDGVCNFWADNNRAYKKCNADPKCKFVETCHADWWNRKYPGTLALRTGNLTQNGDWSTRQKMVFEFPDLETFTKTPHIKIAKAETYHKF